MGAPPGKKTLWSCVPSPDRRIWGVKVLYMPTEECDWRLASGFLLCVSWCSLGARSFLRLPEAEPNDPSVASGSVELLPPDPVAPAPVLRRVHRARSSAASQHRQGRVVPILKLVGHGSKLRCVQTRTWSLARQRRSSHESRIGIRRWTRRRRRRRRRRRNK